jgi:hypothetical protein
VIGGLTSSLVLTLILVPIMFIWIAPGPPKKKPQAELPAVTPLPALEPR